MAKHIRIYRTENNRHITDLVQALPFVEICHKFGYRGHKCYKIVLLKQITVLPEKHKQEDREHSKK